MTDENKKSNGLSEGLLLALVPAIAYGMAYLYEAAYCHAFNIPTQFISLSLGNVLAVSVGLLSSLILLFWIGNVLGGILYPDILGSAVGRAIHATLIPAVLLICVLLLTRPPGAFLYFTVAILTIAFFNLVFPLITNRKRTGYAKKLEGQEEIESKVNLLSDYLLRSIPLQLQLVIFVSGILLGGAWLLGGGEARNEEKFLVPTSQPNKVVLRRYADVLILATFDRASKTVSQEFSFVDVTSADVTKATRFRSEKVGPLKAHAEDP